MEAFFKKRKDGTMKNIRKLGVLFMVAIMALAMTACGGSGSSNKTDYSKIKTDTAKKTVTIYAKVNGKYFTEVTRHGVVFKGGSNGEKAVFKGLCSEKKFYAALISLGLEPGDNLATTSPVGTAIDGPKLDVKVTWDGQKKAVPFGDCIKTGDGSAYKTDIRFGGNIKNAYKFNTGCILCLDSCPVGITSNAAYGWGAVETAKTQKFYGNSKVLPKDGTVCKITFTAE